MARTFVGKRIAEYTVEQKLGHGGMGAVYLARRNGEPPVAIKILSGPHTDDPQFVQRFAQEAAITARLDHPNLVHLLEYGEDPEAGHYLVMQYIPGPNLRELLQQAGPLPVGRAVSLARQVALALEYAHAQGVVHRDLKPDNLICPSPERVVLTDFGVARAPTTQALTRTGFLPGTPEYMSPEQLSNATSGPASDLYSLGLVLYELLTGQSPFRSDNVAEVIQRQVYHRPLPPSRLRPGIPRSLDAAVMRCLEKDPRHRFPSARALADALDDLPEDAPPAPPAPTQLVAVITPPRRRRSPWLVPAAFLALAVLLFGITLTHLQSPPVWLKDAVGTEPVPLEQGLTTALTVHGIEVALFESRRNRNGRERALSAGDRLAAVLRERTPEPEEVLVEQRSGRWVVHLKNGPELFEITQEIGRRLGGPPEELAAWWQALLRDQLALRRGQKP
ncbi:MAG: serine/threonine-protein kinase, partial [Candidatus Eremiobacterota bacterium]